MDEIRRVIVFAVGNPGPVNRHSAGKYILKRLAESFGIEGNQQSTSLYASSEYGNYTLVKSSVFMNESGKALKQCLRDIHSPQQATSLVILYDDFELNAGKCRLLPMKSPESHKGLSICLKVINQTTGLDPDYIFKLGIGIGPKPKNSNKLTMSTWVLSRFKMEELHALDQRATPLVHDYLELMLKEGTTNALEQTARINKIFAKKIQRGVYT